MRAALTEELFPFLSSLSKDGRHALGALVPARAKPHRSLLRRGDVAGGAYLILSGSLRVYYVSKGGREATLYTVERGGTCVLALAATLNEEPYPACVDAGPAGGEYVVVPARLVSRLLDGERAFRDFVFEALSGRILELMRTLEEVGLDQVQQRVARYLVKHQGPDACVRASQARIAAELGSAREVVFRALRSLSELSLVKTGRLRIQIIDEAGLNRIGAEPRA
jgi:CRP/FNR family transcriptional regulator, anaerobic regulatory protein